jgi:lysophospholipase L1-like esterase
VTRRRGRLRGFLGALALATAGLVAALAVGEAMARILAPSRAPAADEQNAGPTLREEPTLPNLRTVAELGRPNARGLHKGTLFRTNRDGFRGPEYSYQPDPDVFRILVIGDSFTMGSGVEESEAYPARLEALLNESPGSGRFEVLNFGLSGLNLRASVRRLERFGLPYQPDLIVYGFTVNDIEGPAYRATTRETERAQTFERYLRFADSPSHLLRVAWPRILSLRDLVLPRPGSFAYDLRENYFRNPEAWGDFTDHLDRLRAVGDEARVCVLVLIHTQIAQLNWLHPWRSIYDKVEDAARENGLAVTQTFPAYRGRRPADLRLSFFDGHPNPAGHELLARELRDGLLALPDACGIPRPRGEPEGSD